MSGRHALLAALLVPLGACGSQPPIPAYEVSLRVEIDAERVVPGRAVPVRVVRSWSKALEPAPFVARSLRPLALTPVATERRENATHVEETLSFRGHAFARADVTVPPSTFAARPKGGGPARVASAPGKVLAVTPEVDARSPGEPEPPDAPAAAPTSWRGWALAAACALLAALLARRRRAGAPEPTSLVAPDEGAVARAARARGRDALAALARPPATTPAERAARVLAVAGIVRAVLEQTRPHSAARTAAELAAHARTAGDRGLAVAARLVLAPAERVAFARLVPGEARLARVLAGARAALAEEQDA
jgi:hypothetical protein